MAKGLQRGPQGFSTAAEIEGLLCSPFATRGRFHTDRAGRYNTALGNHSEMAGM